MHMAIWSFDHMAKWSFDIWQQSLEDRGLERTKAGSLLLYLIADLPNLYFDLENDNLKMPVVRKQPAFRQATKGLVNKPLNTLTPR